ncbi:MAG TPA: hypothetical protein VM030_05200, partial [Acidimicrobiales bacterium]|nr:hypothetical protein [Acidimicrobiales bacterium]
MTVTSRHVRVAGVEDARAIAEVHVASWLAAYRGIIDDDVLDGLSVDARAARWVENLTDPEADATTLLV